MNTGNLKELERRIKRLERANPLSASSLGRGRMRFYDGSELLIENGALNVTGSATISGVLNVSGQTNLSGQVSVTGPMNITGTTTIGGNTNITGELNVTGPTTLDGITDIGGDTTVSGLLDVTGPMSTKGTLSVEGVTTLQNDLNVTSGGKIKAGNLEIEPANGGQINFTGGSLSAGQFGALLNNLTAVELQAPTVKLNTSNVNINSLPSKPASELTPIGIDSAGRLHRIA
jgi:cytoskeletal protein CcmA (bactofilin family)